MTKGKGANAMRDIGFDEIAKDILANKKYQKIDLESHHGITRLGHTLRVSRNVYRISKKFHFDYVSATRAALLHDFFTNAEFGNNSGLIQGVVHPDIALQNAKGEFKLNKIEENAIEAHMFPLSTTLPRSKEAWTLTLVDKVIAIYEYSSYKFNYKKLVNKGVAYITLAGIFIFNILTMGNN